MAQNFKWGPFQGTGGFTAGAEFLDNANTSHDHPKADVELTLGPTLSGGVFLPFAGGEQLTLTMAATYVQSLTGVTPNSFGAPLTVALTLPVYVAEWNVVVTETFNFTNDPLENTFAVNRTRVEEYFNSAGATATRQFGKFSTTFAAQRYDYIFPSDASQEETDYEFSFTPSFMLAQGYSVFMRTSGGLTYLSDPTLQDSTGYSIDFGVNGQLTPSLSGTISLGFTHDYLEANGTNTAHNIDGVDSNLILSYTHPLRPNTTHSISFYRDPGVALLLKSSSITQATGVNYTISQRLNQYLTLSPQIGWTHLESLFSTHEVADLIQVGFGLQRTFTKHLTGSFSYLYQTRDSNIAANSYDVNEVTVTANYTF
ncbi:MAG TPA: outer membrane beta-barrel protein [Verrucomicrobiae bacterium]|nr:outer membrane beta-barrel protein [Verrucomicrobiae bacterium]